jgi:hypothetical protein
MAYLSLRGLVDLFQSGDEFEGDPGAEVDPGEVHQKLLQAVSETGTAWFYVGQ